MKEIKRSEIYYADLNPVRGSEQGGIRPVLIIQNDVGNKHSPTTIVAAITSRQTKAKLPTHVDVSVEGLTKDSIPFAFSTAYYYILNFFISIRLYSTRSLNDIRVKLKRSLHLLVSMQYPHTKKKSVALYKF